jgi:hypothetical protein
MPKSANNEFFWFYVAVTVIIGIVLIISIAASAYIAGAVLSQSGTLYPSSTIPQRITAWGLSVGSSVLSAAAIITLIVGASVYGARMEEM